MPEYFYAVPAVTYTHKQAMEGVYRVTRGAMSFLALPAAAAQVSTVEPLTGITWDAPRLVDADKRPAVLAALQADCEGLTATSPDVYMFGKEVCL